MEVDRWSRWRSSLGFSSFRWVVRLEIVVAMGLALWVWLEMEMEMEMARFF